MDWREEATTTPFSLIGPPNLPDTAVAINRLDDSYLVLPVWKDFNQFHLGISAATTMCNVHVDATVNSYLLDYNIV